MEALLVIIALAVPSIIIAPITYRLGKEAGWQEGTQWAIRADLTQLRSPEFEGARQRRRIDD